MNALCDKLAGFGTILFGNDNCDVTDKQRAALGPAFDKAVHFIAVRE